MAKFYAEKEEEEDCDDDDEEEDEEVAEKEEEEDEEDEVEEVEEEIVEEAEGWKLHLSSHSNTGYRGVRKVSPGRYLARRQQGAKSFSAFFDTAAEAAVAYAKAVAEDDYQEEDQEKDQEEDSSFVTEAAGYQLYLSDRTATGYRGVRWAKGRGYQVNMRIDGRTRGLGIYETAVEAAIAYAKAAAAQATKVSETQGNVVKEAEGMNLHLSHESPTGYLGVTWRHARRLFEAQVMVDGRMRHIGSYSTALEAAVAYARYVMGDERQEGDAEQAEEAKDDLSVAAEIDGTKLHLSERNASGYLGVYRRRTSHSGDSYGAYFHFGMNDRVELGSFTSAEEAAIAYAKFAHVVSTQGRNEAESLVPEQQHREQSRPCRHCGLQSIQKRGVQWIQKHETSCCGRSVRAVLNGLISQLEIEHETERRSRLAAQLGVQEGPAVQETGWCEKRWVREPSEVASLNVNDDPERCSCDAPEEQCDPRDYVSEDLPQGVVSEAQGMKLHLSDAGGSGYKGVKRTDSGKFSVRLEGFNSAVEAAVAYATAVAAQQRAAALNERDVALAKREAALAAKEAALDRREAVPIQLLINVGSNPAPAPRVSSVDPIAFTAASNATSQHPSEHQRPSRQRRDCERVDGDTFIECQDRLQHKCQALDAVEEDASAQAAIGQEPGAQAEEVVVSEAAAGEPSAESKWQRPTREAAKVAAAKVGVDRYSFLAWRPKVMEAAIKANQPKVMKPAIKAMASPRTAPATTWHREVGSGGSGGSGSSTGSGSSEATPQPSERTDLDIADVEADGGGTEAHGDVLAAADPAEVIAPDDTEATPIAAAAAEQAAAYSLALEGGNALAASRAPAAGPVGELFTC